MTEQDANSQLDEFRKTRDPARTEVALSSDGRALSIGKVKASLSELKVLYRQDDSELPEI